LGAGPSANGFSQGSAKTTAKATTKPRLAGAGEGEDW
jgi:hypothetical protein